MKHFNELPSGEENSNGIRLPRFNNSKLWLVTAGAVIATTGVVLAQNASSRLPAPPTPPAPAVGAPLPPNGGPRPPRPAPPAPTAGAPLPPDGGPERGPQPTPPDANTLQGSARSLERAYRAAGEVGDVKGDPHEVAMAARSFYADALQAFNAKHYAHAFQLAEASNRLSHNARTLADASGRKPAEVIVPGLTPPPIVAKPAADAGQAARELHRNFDEANRAASFNNDATNRYVAMSEKNYRAALQAYDAKNYNEAATMAHLGAEQAKAGREYAEALAL